jgi:hypothetical protein
MASPLKSHNSNLLSPNARSNGRPNPATAQGEKDQFFNDDKFKNETQEFWQVLRRIKELKLIQKTKEISIYKNQVAKANQVDSDDEDQKQFDDI